MPDPVAVLLCAGYGTRMGALTAEVPKPLLPVAGKPVLDYLVEQLLELRSLQVSPPGVLSAVHVVANARHYPRFAAWAADWRRRLLRRGHSEPAIEVHDDGTRRNDERLGAVGDLAFLLARLDALPDGALVAAGDNILRFSLAPLWRAFVASGHSQVLALREEDAEKLRRTGVLELGPGGRVLKLHEKPADPPSHWACPSVYCLSGPALRRVGPYLAAEGPRDEIGRFVADLVARQQVDAVETAGERLHVGSPKAYRRAQEVLRRDRLQRWQPGQ